MRKTLFIFAMISLWIKESFHYSTTLFIILLTFCHKITNLLKIFTLLLAKIQLIFVSTCKGMLTLSSPCMQVNHLRTMVVAGSPQKLSWPLLYSAIIQFIWLSSYAYSKCFICSANAWKLVHVCFKHSFVWDSVNKLVV